MLQKSLIVLALAWFALAFAPPAGATQVIIGTGGPTGVYYPLGQAICGAVNHRADETGITCKAITTGGSVDNVEKLHANSVNFAIVQSDIQFFAVNGYGPFHDAKADKTLRAVLAFYPESFTIVARKDANIHSLADLKGKRVNIGNPGSGQRTSMDLIMHFEGWTQKSFAETWELTSDKQGKALCSGIIDAYVFTAGHPNASIKDTAEQCDVVLVSAYDKAVKAVVKRYPYFAPVRIPGDTYRGTGGSTPTFGTMATLVTLAGVDDDVVKNVVMSIFEDFIDFKFAHPALSNLDPEKMVKAKQFAPIHKGALKYFETMGYDPQVEAVRPPH